MEVITNLYMILVAAAFVVGTLFVAVVGWPFWSILLIVPALLLVLFVNPVIYTVAIIIALGILAGFAGAQFNTWRAEFDDPTVILEKKPLEYDPKTYKRKMVVWNKDGSYRVDEE